MVTTSRGDLAVRAPNGEMIAVVEVKNREDLSPEVAAALRRNLVVHGFLTDAPYFLLVSQDVGFLWDRRAQHGFDALPTARFPMEPVINRYLPERTVGDRLRGSELELVVFQWLLDLTETPKDVLGEPERSLDGSGLLDAMRGARITNPVSV
jgi:hypothetical protein